MARPKQLDYDQEVIETGEQIASLTFDKHLNPKLLESLVLRASVLSGQRIDWYNQGSIGAGIKALGDNTDLAKRFMEEELRHHTGMYSIVKDKNLYFKFPEAL